MEPSPTSHMRKPKRKQPPTNQQDLSLLAEIAKQQYSPFDSPHILRVQPSRVFLQGPHCRELFQDDNQDIFTLVKSPSKESSTGLSGSSHEEGENEPSVVDSRWRQIRQSCDSIDFPNFGKENLRRQQQIGFNQLRRARHCDTTGFKEVLGTPLRGVQLKFKRKMDGLKRDVCQGPIVALPLAEADPRKHRVDYKFFIRIAEGMRQQHSLPNMRALYKLALYMQPFDDSCWEWAIKFEDDCGDHALASKLARTGYLFTGSDFLVEKYLALGHKIDKPLGLYGDLLSTIFSWSRSERRHRSLFELAKLCWTFGQQSTSLRLLQYLLRHADLNTPYLPEMMKYYEAIGQSQRACSVLFTILKEKPIKLAAVYSSCLKFAEELLVGKQLKDMLDFLLVRLHEVMQNDSKWKLLTQLGLSYNRLGQNEQAQSCLSQALELAPNPMKIKVYLTILRTLGKEPQYMRQSQVIMEINRNRFIQGRRAEDYPFQEWKYYFHYSLFYLINRDQHALSLIEGATKRWPYSGRLAAEMLFVKRVNSTAEEALNRWEAIAVELPKSGEVWCEGGRIFMELQNWERAEFCFQAAILLTPQYGDSFIEAYKLSLLRGDKRKSHQYKYRIMQAQPFYGNVWSYLKAGNNKISVQQSIDQFSQNWKAAKRLVKSSLYRNNIAYRNYALLQPLKLPCQHIRQLTAIDEFNLLFQNPQKITRVEREHLFFAYDQMEPHKY